MENYTLTKLITAQSIKKRLTVIAKQIKQDYKGKTPVIIGIMKGSFIFCADIIRCLPDSYDLDFITISSYKGTKSSKLKAITKLKVKLKNRDIIIVEDILDSGNTLAYLIKEFNKQKPNSIAICALLDKKCKRKHDIQADYACFEIDDFFVVGYGLDYNEKFRALPDICTLKLEANAGE
jgi:hypoxanthine phosphoribosyltransferase